MIMWLRDGAEPSNVITDIAIALGQVNPGTLMYGPIAATQNFPGVGGLRSGLLGLGLTKNGECCSAAARVNS